MKKFRLLTYHGLLLGIILLLNACQSINTSFGSFEFNHSQEVTIGTVGHLEEDLFTSSRFVSFANALGTEKLQLSIKTDSTGLSSKQGKLFYGEYEESKALTKQQRQVHILSVLDKQSLIERINEQIDLESVMDMKVVTELVLKDEAIPISNKAIETLYVQFNTNQQAYQLICYTNGKKTIINLNPNDIIGYSSLYLCCENSNAKTLVKHLASKSCVGSTDKTLRLKTKTEDYEKL